MSNTAEAWPKHSDSPNQRGANLFQMHCENSVFQALSFLLGREILSRNPDRLMRLGESHSPAGRTKNRDSSSRAARFRAESHCCCSDNKAKQSGSIYPFVICICRGTEPGSAK